MKVGDIVKWWGCLGIVVEFRHNYPEVQIHWIRKNTQSYVGVKYLEVIDESR